MNKNVPDAQKERPEPLGPEVTPLITEHPFKLERFYPLLNSSAENFTAVIQQIAKILHLATMYFIMQAQLLDLS